MSMSAALPFLLTILGSPDEDKPVAFSHGSTYIASGSEGGAIGVWSMDDRSFACDGSADGDSSVDRKSVV